MEQEEDKDEGLLNSSFDLTELRSAVNPTILDYYKKFGRKRDLEQYFSLSTAQSEVRDPSSLFWRKMKAENESSDSSDKNETSTEICRISVKCSVMDQSTSPEGDKKQDKSESVSPPIIIEEMQEVEGDQSRHSENESNKSDGYQSHKSIDGTLDTSNYKLQSPASSVTSQRKLEWDSLADVGYANENERIASSSSLSTLERLALKQQYTDNQTHIGMPDAQSTPLEEQARKNKRLPMKKTTEIHKKDIDVFEINVPHSSNQMPSQSINVNLTKHISFNVENSGVKVDNSHRQVNVTSDVVREPIVTYPETVKEYKFDKEIQTSLRRNNDDVNRIKTHNDIGIPVVISLNTLKRRMKRKTKRVRRKPSKTRYTNKNISEDKTGDHVSDAESFEYMPGHIYNQNKLKDKQKTKSVAENKSSLESSGGLTTGSSKASNLSFTKDLDRCIDSIKSIMQEKHNDTIVKKKLVKDIVQRLLKSKYKDDESNSDVVSRLDYSSKRLGLPREYTTTSTSDVNNSEDKKPSARKSILRSDKFNPSMIASTSQSVPNISAVANSDDLARKLVKPINSSSEISSKCKDSSDNSNAPKTSSEELYQKYLLALKREQAYKAHLLDKEKFVRQKLVGSDSALRQPIQSYMENSKLRDLIKDLTRNNYDDGSGDASKLEGGSINSYGEESRSNIRKQKSHSRFTLSDNSDQNKKNQDAECSSHDPSKNRGLVKNTHYCCCPLHSCKIDGIDSGCQVNIQTVTSGPSGQAEKARRMKECQRKPHSQDCGCYKAKNDIAVFNIPQQRYPQSAQNSSSSHTNSVAVQSDGEDYKSGSSKAFKNRSIAEKCSQSSQTNISLNLNPYKNDCTVINMQKITVDRAYASSPVKIKSIVGGKEVTRWVQTEISIDPKISDPSICDINIVNEIDIGIVEEPVSSKTESVASSCRSVRSGTSQDLFKRTFGSNEYVAGQQICETQCIIEEPVSQGNSNPPSQYSIPVQGTNVKFIMSITPQLSGSQVIQTCSGNIDVGVVTDYEGVENKGTCLEVECSKSIQVESVKTDFGKSVNTGSPRENANTQSVNSKECSGAKSDEGTSSDSRYRCTQKDSATQNEKQRIFSSQQHQGESKKSEASDFYGCYGTIGYQVGSTKKTENIEKNDNNYGCYGSTEQQASSAKSNVNNNTIYGCYGTVGYQTGSAKRTENIEKNNNNGFYSTMGQQTSSAKTTENNNNHDSHGTTAPTAKIPHTAQNNSGNNYGVPTATENRPSSARTEKDTNNYGAWASSHQHKTYTNRIGSTKEDVFYTFTNTQQYEANISGTSKQNENVVIDSANPPPPDKLWAMNHEKNLCPTYKCKEDTQKSKDKCKGEQTKQCYVNVFYDDGQTQRFATYPNLPKKRVVYSHTDPNCQCTANFPTGPCPSGYYYENQCETKVYQTKCHEKQDIKSNAEKILRQPACDYPSDKSDKSSSKASSAAKSKTNQKEEYETRHDNYQDQNCNLKRKESFFLERPKDSSCEDIHRSSDDNPLCMDDYEKDPVMKIIKDITKKYTKKDNAKHTKKKCFKEILSLLNYLLDTEDSTDRDAKQSCSEESYKISKSVQCDCCDVPDKNNPPKYSPRKTSQDKGIGTSSVNLRPECEKKSKTSEVIHKQSTDKGVQCKSERNYVFSTESSDLPTSSDLQVTSDSTTCKILSRIKKECEKYHQKKGRSGTRKYDVSSSTSVNCDTCKKIHYCGCRIHKCKSYKMKSCCDKKRRPVAYNLIIQPSDSIIAEECQMEQKKKLKNIVVKVPSRKFNSVEHKHSSHKHNMKYEEYQNQTPNLSPDCHRQCFDNMTSNASNSNSAPQGAFCVREYLERNRPDFIENTSKRQDCLKTINECRTEDCGAPVKMVVMHSPDRNSYICHGNNYTEVSCSPPVKLNPTTEDKIGWVSIVKVAYRDLIYRYCPKNKGKKIRLHPYVLSSKGSAVRRLLSMQLEGEPALSEISAEDLMRLSKELGMQMRNKKVAPKFISEREMKKHSEKIYKSLPEVKRKKEEIKKENIKKTNQLMANIFKKNLQKKTLRGSVNLSNYSTVIKI